MYGLKSPQYSWVLAVARNTRYEVSASLLVRIAAIESSAESRPLREASNGLTLRRASYVVLCTMGTSRLPARRAESSLSATLSLGRRASSAGVTRTRPITFAMTRAQKRAALSCVAVDRTVRQQL